MPLPDKEAIDAQVQFYAEAARAANPNVEVGPIPHVETATPIYMGKAHEVIPHSYMLHYKLQHCKSCGHDEMLSQFYALSFIRSRVTGQRVTHLIPCDTPLYNLPIETKLVGRVELPFCHACMNSADLSNLPGPPQESQLYDLDEPRLKGQKPAASKEPKPSKKATLDDLA